VKTSIINVAGLAIISISIYLGLTYEKSTFMQACEIEILNVATRMSIKTDAHEIKWNCEVKYLNNGKD